MRAEIAGLMPGILTDLASLVRIPSVSADESAADAMDRSAAAVAALFADTCLTEVEVVRADDLVARRRERRGGRSDAGTCGTQRGVRRRGTRRADRPRPVARHAARRER